jgi:hypothetical protein
METSGTGEGTHPGDVDDGTLFGCESERSDVGAVFEGVVGESKPIFPKVSTGEALSTANLRRQIDEGSLGFRVPRFFFALRTLRVGSPCFVKILETTRRILLKSKQGDPICYQIALGENMHILRIFVRRQTRRE